MESSKLPLKPLMVSALESQEVGIAIVLGALIKGDPVEVFLDFLEEDEFLVSEYGQVQGGNLSIRVPGVNAELIEVHFGQLPVREFDRRNLPQRPEVRAGKVLRRHKLGKLGVIHDEE